MISPAFIGVEWAFNLTVTSGNGSHIRPRV